MGRTSRREALLDAARDVVLTDGPLALTLDAVGARAGISKGGVLYHFPSKASLVLGLVDRMLDRFDVELAAAAAVDPRPGGRFLRAYLAATLTEIERDGALAGLLAALVHEPALLERWRERARTWRALAAADGLDPARAAVVGAAIDGLWLAALAGLPLGVSQTALVHALQELTRP